MNIEDFLPRKDPMDSLPASLTSADFQLKLKSLVCPLTPMDDYVICERCESTDSVLVPDHLKKPSNKGRVVAVGPGRLLQNGQYAPLPLEIGDTVIFGGYLKPDAGVEIDGAKYLICQAGDIIAKYSK